MGTDDQHIKSTVAVYNSIAAQYAVEIEAHAPEAERVRFCQLVKPESCILDVGCGPGRDAAYFETKGYQVAGVDLSDSLLAIARKVAANAEFYKMDMRSLTFPDNSYDAIWCCAALLHLKRAEIPSVLQTFFKILKPGGILFILVKEGEKEGFFIEPSIKDKSRYYTYFTLTELKKLLSESTFNVLDIYSWNESDRFKDGYPTEWISAFAQKP